MAEEVAVKNESAAGDAQVVDEALQQKIIKQVEYYFGDINLMKDNFLKEKIQEDDGWVTLETMLKFNRLKSLSDDTKVICDALRKSDKQLIEVSDENNKIRRNPEKPLPGDSKEHREEVTARTVYAKVFPEDSKMDDLMSFFEGYGIVENLFMRRDFRKKNFKGSVFVTYAKKEEAEKFMDEEGTKFNDEELVKKFKSVYYTDKLAEKKTRKGSVGEKDNRKDTNVKEEETEDDIEERVKQQMTKNSVLHLKGMDPETTMGEIKDFFGDITPVGWVDFDSGVTEGYLRLREPNSAGPAVEKAKEQGDGKIVIKGKEIEVRAVEGDEELEYWKKMFKDISAKKKSGGFGNRGGRRGGGRGGGGRGGGGRGGYQGKRRHDKRNHGSDEPSNKAAKTE